ncbi:MAG: amidohydrolase [Archaeoglobaceae archaeon]|uniref:5-methylthioadenosine/S-adenosylhomocysteine deaminase n=1 Tax=Archaeoglobus fulgidus TaxID=2234 RepID=A0A7J3M5M6_ARCFL
MFDLVIKNGLCFIDDRFVECNIGIEGNRIASISKEKLRGEEEINAKDCLVLPGFFNAHTHSAMTLLRGYAEALPLKEWLEKVWKIEAKLNETSIYWGAMIACIEMLKHGFTCFADMYIHMDSVAKAVQDTGIRAVLGYGMADRGIPERGEEELGIAMKFIENWEGRERIKTMLTPHAIYTCSADFLKKINEFARRKGLLKHIHASETLWEVRESKKRFGKTPISFLDSIGFLDEKTILAHCVWVSDEEMGILAERGVSVTHCPSSNLKLSSGIAKIAEMVEKGVNVAIGTDGAASNNLLNPFVEIRTATLMQQLRRKFIPPQKFIQMASENGYRAYKIEGGRLEQGKLADLLILELKSNHAPFYDLTNSIVFATLGCEVRDTIVDGKIVVEDRQTIFVDEEKAVDKVLNIAKTLLL